MHFKIQLEIRDYSDSSKHLLFTKEIQCDHDIKKDDQLYLIPNTTHLACVSFTILDVIKNIKFVVCSVTFESVRKFSADSNVLTENGWEKITDSQVQRTHDD
jgi:hypothetical protein